MAAACAFSRLRVMTFLRFACLTCCLSSWALAFEEADLSPLKVELSKAIQAKEAPGAVFWLDQGGRWRTGRWGGGRWCPLPKR